MSHLKDGAVYDHDKLLLLRFFDHTVAVGSRDGRGIVSAFDELPRAGWLNHSGECWWVLVRK
ncbi:MAG: hypothetical protein VX700_06530 [Pseudomonadota bacterium]|nr:hypothetical protein [Pseudomonadota bacterium]